MDGGGLRGVGGGEWVEGVGGGGGWRRWIEGVDRGGG